MPKLEGESLEDAVKRLEMMDLNLVVGTPIEEASETVPKGYVIRTDPTPDTKLNKGHRITIYVSLGSDKMPDLIGQSKNNATVLLRDMGLDLQISADLEESSEEVEEGNVCRTEPAPGEKLKKGQQVKVYISTGSKYTTVPSVINMPEAEAKRALEEANLMWVLGDPAFYEGIPEGYVGGMSVMPETKVEKGTTVTIYLCEEPEEVTEPTTESTAPTETTTESTGTETPSSEGNE